MAHKHRLAAALVSLGCLQAASAWGLGLGNLTLESFLNEPLRARVSLLDVNDLDEDQIRIRLATNEDFDRMGVDRAYFLTGIKFDVEVDNDGRGYILLTSDDPVLEPYLDFIVEARWPSGRLLRNYTVLVDPPAFDERSPVVSASRRVTEVEAESEQPASATSAGSEPRSSGTEVDLRQSGLAPGAMPERNYGAEAAAEPAPGSRYMIRRDETLWTIAQRARPEGTTVQQTMLDIQRLNPDAFIDGNINRIKAGYIIYLPASGEISSEDMAAALAQVRQQNTDWREGRASSTAGPALRVSSGEAEPIADPGTGAAGVGRAGGTAAAETAGGAASGIDTAVLEDLERSQLERDELAQRLAAISERLETLERIVELKDSQIAALQRALDDASAAAGTASGPAPEGRQTQDDESPAAAVPVTPAAEAPGGEPAPPVAPAPESGNWLYILAAAVVAGLLALLFWRRRQQDDEELAAEDVDIPVVAAPLPSSRNQRDAFAGVQLQDQALEVDHGEEQTPRKSEPVEETPVVAAVSQRGYGERKHDQYASDVDAGDALAEADIYIAYGRFPQTMELLRKAIAADPDNPDYRLKLLELAVETGERDEASQQLAQLQRIGDDHSVARAQALMSGAGGLGAGATAAGPLPPDADDSYPGRTAAVDPGKQAVADLADDTQSYLAPESAADPEAPDLSSPPPAQPLPADLSPPDLSEYSGNLSDFDGSGEAEAEADYDLSEALADLQPRSGDGRDELVPAVDESLESEFLDLEIEDSPVEELDVSTEFERGGKGSGPHGEDDFVFADDGDPLSTKLDLARAYIDMGDQDGAREILEEVAAEGSDEQQAEARTLMDRFV